MLGPNPLVIPSGRTPVLGSIPAPPPAPIQSGEQNPDGEQHSQEGCVSQAHLGAGGRPQVPDRPGAQRDR